MENPNVISREDFVQRMMSTERHKKAKKGRERDSLLKGYYARRGDAVDRGRARVIKIKHRNTAY